MTEPTTYTYRPRMTLSEGSGHRERRKSSRMAVAYMRCFSASPGTIFNVSRGGVAIETYRPFKRGDNVFLTSEVNAGPNGRSAASDGAAR